MTAPLTSNVLEVQSKTQVVIADKMGQSLSLIFIGTPTDLFRRLVEAEQMKTNFVAIPSHEEKRDSKNHTAIIPLDSILRITCRELIGEVPAPSKLALS